jgi:hypothetical protein
LFPIAIIPYHSLAKDNTKQKSLLRWTSEKILMPNFFWVSHGDEGVRKRK